jgi:hypothetical protein
MQQHFASHCCQPPMPHTCCVELCVQGAAANSPLPRSPHHLRSQARATGGSALKIEHGTARSLVGWFSGRREMTQVQLSPLSLMRSSPGAGNRGQNAEAEQEG